VITLRHFLGIIDRQTLIVTLLALASTWLCRRLGLAADMPTGLIGVAIVFPIVFSINAAYRRREEALRHFASLKAHAAALYFAHRDWVPDSANPPADGHPERAKEMIEGLLEATRAFLLAAQAEREERLDRVFEVFSRFSRSHEALRRAGVPANEISRANQYLRAMMIDFERLRNIRLYRTPVSLRAYSRVFLNAFPVVFGPYFAHLAGKSYPAVGYGLAAVYALVLVSLDNIQEDLENPFDAVGEDDVRLDAAGEYRRLLDD